MPTITSIIFIPGIEATTLVDSNTFDFDVRRNAFDSLLTSIGTNITGPQMEDKLQQIPLYEENIRSIVEQNHIARLPYERAIKNIAAKSPDDPVYLFGYGWRLSNAENGKRLAAQLQYYKDKLKSNLTVNGFRFKTHSMDALVFCSYLTEVKENYSDIDSVAFCAPPFKGSPFALVHMVKGDGGLKSFLSKIFGRNDDIRKVIRTYPAIFELLPWYNNAILFDQTTIPVDLTNYDHWQSNVDDYNKSLLKARIDALAAFRKKELFDLAKLPVNLRSRMVIIAGSEDKTITNLKILKQKDDTKIFGKLDDIVNGSEDGTVPFESATVYNYN